MKIIYYEISNLIYLILQHLIHVFHPLTSEHTVYNPVRAKRPMPTQQTNLYEWLEKLSEETSKNCDFCKYNEMTAVDEFGRWATFPCDQLFYDFVVLFSHVFYVLVLVFKWVYIHAFVAGK